MFTDNQLKSTYIFIYLYRSRDMYFVTYIWMNYFQNIIYFDGKFW